MDETWKELDHDPVSGRKIFAADDEYVTNSPLGSDETATAGQFEVRAANGDVLLKAFGTGKGERWSGAFLFFVEGSNGAKVRLHQSSRDDIFCDVPDTPSDPPEVLKHWK